uniref:Uncharacterized protein n=1 Tax=Hyaloperonospora arabidopsidis (strain Emoy2) TaxID=559515 RepID=M4BYH0_HYAAE
MSLVGTWGSTRVEWSACSTEKAWCEVLACILCAYWIVQGGRPDFLLGTALISEQTVVTRWFGRRDLMTAAVSWHKERPVLCQQVSIWSSQHLQSLLHDRQIMSIKWLTRKFLWLTIPEQRILLRATRALSWNPSFLVSSRCRRGWRFFLFLGRLSLRQS